MANIMAPHVLADCCVGCCICTYRCHQKYVVQEGRLIESAIPVVAENEDRLMSFPSTPKGYARS